MPFRGRPVYVKPNIRVTANAPSLSPCMTRDMHPPGTSFTMRTFDRLGCEIVPGLGLRVPDDCSTPDTRYLCPGGPPIKTVSDVIERLTSFIETVSPIATKLIPIIGPGLSEVIGPAIQSLLSGKSIIAEILGEQLKALLFTVVDYATRAYRFVSVVVSELAIKEVRILAASAKAVIDMVRPLVFLAAREVSGVVLTIGASIKEGFGIATRLLEGDAASFSVLKDLAINSAVISNYADVNKWLDMRKMLVFLQDATEYAKRVIGGLVPANLRALHDAFPNFENMTAENLSRVYVDPFVFDVADRYAGQGTKAVEALVPEVLGEIVPSAERSRFVAEMNMAERFMTAMNPAILEAQQIGRRAENLVMQYLAIPLPLRLPPQEFLRSEEARMREILRKSKVDQDLVIKSAAEAIRRAPRRFAPSGQPAPRAVAVEQIEVLTPVSPMTRVMIAQKTTPHEYE